MIGIINASLDRTRTVILLFLLVFLSGVVALINIPKEAQPDITIPYVYVGTGLEGISPEDSDRLLVRPLEQELNSIEGLKEITSTASEGRATLTLEFGLEVDIDVALTDVRQAVDAAKGKLPAEADDPTVQEINLALFPVINISLAGNVDERVLFRVAEDLKERLESLSGILEATINGKREEVAEIIIDPAQMSSYNISHSELFNLVSRNNQLVTAGNLDTGAGRFSFKVPGLIETSEDILDLPIKVSGDTVVRFRDIAVAQRTYKDANSISRVDGQPAVTLEVKKRVGENVIATIDQAKEVVAAVSPFWPEGITVTFTQDNSVMIKQQLNDLFNSVLTATLLVFVVIVWTLGVRSAVLVGLAIPASFLAAILTLSLMGITLNIVVLFALILSVGMLVDGAIVVTEYADRRMSEGADKKSAYREAATRMAWPVIASTATTLAVFMPLLFWPGLPGEFMGFLPKTVLITLTASMVMALIAVPAFGFMFGKPIAVSKNQKKTMDAIDHGEFHKIPGILGMYVRFIGLLLRHAGKVTLMFIAGFAFIVFAIGENPPTTEFFPNVDADFGSIVVRARGNLSLAERDTLVKQVEAKVLKVANVKTVTTKVNASPLRDYREDTIGVMMLEFVDWTPARPGTSIIMEQVVNSANDVPGIVVESKEAQMGPTTGIDIQLQFFSDDLVALRAAVDLVVKRMQADVRIKDVSDNRPLDGLEWRIDVDREAATRFGTDVATVGSSIRMITNGLKIGSYRPDDADDEVDIRARYPFNGRDLDQIDELTITVRGQQVPISNFIERKAQNKQGDLFRTDGKLTFNVEANLAVGETVSVVVADLGVDLQALYDSGEFPENVAFRFVGDQQEQQDTMTFLGNAFLIALFAMFIILVTQFNSLMQAVLILSAIITSTLAVFASILVTGGTFGIVMSGVGIIALAGIVVNNNIVLIDTYNVIRKQGLAPVEAAMVTCAQRIRPILLTTITTILGLIPMVMQLTIDMVNRDMSIGAPSSQWWTQLSSAIAGGLTFATLLTLLLTPCLLILIERLKRTKT
ncbi:MULTISPECIES: efflux RND transporter permease subunit [Reinekea]|uniref:RND multidrug efflux transporter / acriflavin resistance protein n=1 Tax=Reinekea forsetii TaxID=1336806 RepID=A0A2K8KPJ3_9GAMM|nr:MULTISPECIES: efflux RND transporter permease subunit [Reinekea]ATX76695.1 RND multidrug efflux transporter / acriflavin resistance protein [Reinekea forsetii]